MELAIHEFDPDVDDREPVEPALVHCLQDSLLDRGDELARDGAADDGVDELEAAAAGDGIHLDVGDAELPVPATLLLVLSLGLRMTRDGLAVGDLHVFGVEVDAELPSEALE